MSFDADKYVEALEPPEIIIGGVTHTGRFLSIDQWTRFESQLKAAVRGDLDMRSLRKLVRGYCRIVFPRRFQFWKPSVGSRVLALPPVAMMKAVSHFFECQGRAMMERPGDVDSGDREEDGHQPGT